MSCPTAARWFVDDKEYYAKESDYALVDCSRKFVSHEIHEGNNESRSNYEADSISFRDLLQLYPCYDFADPGRLLWADVDDTKPEHKSEVWKVLAEAKDEDHLEDYKLVWNELKPILAKNYGDYDESDKDNDSSSASLASDDARQILDEHIYDGRIAKRLLSLILEHFKDGDKRQRLFELFTSRGGSTIKRPVMILVGMVDSMQNPNPGEKSGYAIGYDMLRDNIICKPFFSDKDHHPLASSWYADFPVKYPNDKIHFVKSTKTFVEDFIKQSDELTLDLKNGKLKELPQIEVDGELIGDFDLDISNKESYAYLLTTMTVTAEFIKHHWDGLVGSNPEATEADTPTLLDKFCSAITNIKKVLSRMVVPVVVSTEKQHKQVCLCAVEEIEWQLEEQEDYFRRAAITAKKQGQEKIAENAARLYEKIMGQLRAFNEDPEKDV